MATPTRDECLRAAAAIIYRAKLRMAAEDIAAELAEREPADALAKAS